MLCEAADRDDVLNVATPPLRVPVPIPVVPLLKVTLSPSGGVPKVELTVAVKVRVWPSFDGVPEVISDVVVLAGSFLTT
jgi:hypothetical protein